MASIKQSGKFLLFCLIFIAALSSCNNFIESEHTEILGIQSKADFVSASEGAEDLFMHLLLTNWYQDINYFADDRTYKNSNPYETYYTNSSSSVHSNSQDDVNERNWIYLYQFILSVNNILQQYNNSKFDLDDIDVKIGELLFIRAYCYFRLVRIYGNLPIVEDTKIDYEKPKSSFSEIYEFIENDLKKAWQLLPFDTGKHTCLAIDKGTVKGLLAELYLSWAGYPAMDATKYQQAAIEAKGLIDSSSYYGLNFITDFKDLWTDGLINTGEDIFCFYVNELNEFNPSWYPYFYTYVESEYTWSFYSIDKTGYTNGPEYFQVEANFYNKFPKGYRKDITFFTTIYVPEDKFNRIERDTGFFFINQVNDDVRPIYRKFFIDTIRYKPDSEFYYAFSPKMCFLKYTQTILTYAEALSRTGIITEETYNLVNQIRRRANHLPLDLPSKFDLPYGLSSQAFADSVVQERAWELAGEPENRWFDLVRLEMVEEVYASKMEGDEEPFFPQNVNGKYFFEIPEYDIRLNPNLNMCANELIIK